MDSHRQPGFTMIELLVALAVAAVLLGVGVPSFVEMVRDGRMSVQYQSLTGAMYLARSEAVKRAELVTVCARKANAMQCGDDWDEGYIVFTDEDGRADDDRATVDATDTILLIEPAVAGGNTLHAYGVKDGSSSAAAAKYVRYLPSGRSEWTVGSVRLCDPENRETNSRVLNISLTGDIRPGRKDAAERPVDAFNKAIRCT